MEKILYGRELLLNEIPAEVQKKLSNISEMEQIKGGKEISGKYICVRCNSKMITVNTHECSCQKACAYCRNCLQMGKVRACSTLYTLKEPNQFDQNATKLLAWDGELSEQQAAASKDIIQSIKNNETRLLWAVAGAGKTEMLFPGIEYALKNNKRVCIATPRIDVALELAPRIQAAFPTVNLALLYGEMEKPYMYTQLVVATTHQLYRFREAFDVLIIDEIDAFPFHLDESLQFAARKSQKEESALIYLSATPDEKMQKSVTTKQLIATILPARYHGHRLPVPQTKMCRNWSKKLLTNFHKTTFGKIFQQKLNEQRKFLIFVPNIEWMSRLEKVLRQLYPTVSFEAVSSEDSLRKEKVMKMRREELQFLISTTILERGVTFPNIDVLVIGAEDRIFTESALVQIAGRCGRAADFPTGEVIYFHDGQSLAMKKAIRQINKMNHLAKERNLIQ